MKAFKLLFILFFILLAPSLLVKAQTMKEEKLRKNIIKLNLSSIMFYKSAVLVEYERIVNKNQSFSLQAGFVSVALGNFLASDSIRVLDFSRNSGFSITGDYRFYLPKENKDPAPHGIYIGPYVAYIHTSNELNLLVGNTTNFLKTEIDVVSIGIEMGYQFLLGKRWTLDLLLIGPSMTKYNASMHLAYPVDPNNPVYEKVLEAMTNRFPVIGSLIKDQGVNFNGSLDKWSAGFRYSVHVGFRF